MFFGDEEEEARAAAFDAVPPPLAFLEEEKVTSGKSSPMKSLGFSANLAFSPVSFSSVKDCS